MCNLCLTAPHIPTHSTEDHRLAYRDGTVYIRQALELLLLTVAVNIVLFDIVQALLLTTQLDDHRVIGDDLLWKYKQVNLLFYSF